VFIGAGRNKKSGTEWVCPLPQRGQWCGIFGGGFALPAKGLGKYCKLRDRFLGETQPPMVSVILVPL